MKVKRFAANRIYLAPIKKMYRNWVVELDEDTHQVIRTFGLEEEIRETEWKGGIILLLKEIPTLQKGERFAEFLERIDKTEYSLIEELRAYYITAFNVNSMEFTVESRIISL